jgi:hypothetical protein
MVPNRGEIGPESGHIGHLFPFTLGPFGTKSACYACINTCTVHTHASNGIQGVEKEIILLRSPTPGVSHYPNVIPPLR